MRVRVRVKLAWLSTVHLMSWKTVPTTSSPSVSCAEMYAWPWGWGRSKGGAEARAEAMRMAGKVEVAVGVKEAARGGQGDLTCQLNAARPTLTLAGRPQP